MSKGGGKLFDYWWHPLLALPPSPASPEYRRLRRLWWDQTRVRRIAGKNVPEFYHPGWETHMTAVLWENFAFLPSEIWFARLGTASGVKNLPQAIASIQWSYGWEAKTLGPQRIKILDVVVHYRSDAGVEGVIVVEAKRPGARVTGGKDLDANYYLHLPAFSEFGRQKSLIYLVDEKAVHGAKDVVKTNGCDVGFLTWESVAGIQVGTALDSPGPEPMRRALASAIYRQFASYGIDPTVKPVEYLNGEHTWREIENRWLTEKQPIGDRQEELWRLPLNR